MQVLVVILFRQWI